MIKYTLGFVKHKNEILLLNREYPGWMGCFNGLGGAIEEGETPFDGIRREIKEEAGIETELFKLCGFVTWKKFEKDSGAYIFVTEIEEKPFIEPKVFDEGILVWKDISWITHPENRGIAKNVLPFIELLFKNELQLHFKTNWEGNNFQGVDILETDIDVAYSKPFAITEVDYKQLAINALKKNFYQNVNALYFIENDLYKELKVIGSSVVLRLNNNGVFIYWDKKLSFKYIEDQLNLSDYKFYMIDNDVRIQLEKTRERKYLSSSVQFYLEDYQCMDFSFCVEPIREGSIDFILENMHYKLGYDKALLEKRISSGHTSAIYIDDLLVAWVYQHDDGSIGGLNVLHGYRNKGYAKAVCNDIICKLIKDGQDVICQINSDNQTSIKLFKSFGFKKSHDIVWVGFHKKG